MKKEIIRTATIQQGRVEMSDSEFRRFLAALGCKPRKGGTLEIHLDSSVYLEDTEDDPTYTVDWRVKSE